MMFSTTKIMKLILAALVTVMLSACGGSDVSSGDTLLTCDVPQIPDASGTMCVDPPPIECPAPTVPDELNEKCVVGVDPNAPAPVYFPAADEAVIYFNRKDFGADNSPNDPAYEGYRIHTWNNATCDAYDVPHDTSDWANGHKHTGVDPNYGAYYVLNLKDGFNECGNFIIHIGTDDAGKALGDGDFRMPLKQDDETYQRMNFTFHGNSNVYEYPLVSLGKQPLKVEGFAAHWLDATTLVWDIDSSQVSYVKLHHSATAGIEADENDMLNGTAIELSMTELTDAQKEKYKLVSGWQAFTANWSSEEAKAILKNQLVLAGYNADDETVSATYVQADKVLDDLYTKGEADADEATLGVVYDNGMIQVSVWAPTAQSVTLKTFDAAKAETNSFAMTEDAATGIWSYSADANLDRSFYQFELSLYHYQNKAIETTVVTDPYSVSLSTNGEYSQFVNLSDDDLKPTGWETHEIPTIANPEDAVIYEGHIRDFSALDSTVTEANRGKYLAFTEMDSAPVMHLKKLADNGMTHFHMLPANDIASINEDPANIVDLTDTVADLCAVNVDAPVCGVESDSAVLQSVLDNYWYNSNIHAVKDLVEAMRGTDSFNWGYDPKHFNVPDGIYASNPDGVARILEMRSMIQALHESGLRTVLDVVYNHTNSAGLWENSVFDKIVPGYYHARDLVSGKVTQSTCCNDTALEHRMMDKFMVDSLKVWTTEYKFDSFRFDIMSHGSKDQMLAARDAIQALDEDNYFYGEGWDRADRGFEQANQWNMAGTEIATFNDRLRDAVRSARMFSNKSNEDGSFIDQDLVKFGMAGSLQNYVLKTYTGADTKGSSATRGMYAKDPADIINYISKHDNETLWDKLQLELPFGTSLNDRVRAQNASHAIVLMSQGIPFLQLGGDFLRSKSLDRNTYDAGDWYNRVDFTFNANNWNVGLPLDMGDNDEEYLVALSLSPLTNPSMSEIEFASAVFNEFLNIRSTSALFRLTTEQDIIDRVGFHNIGKRQQQGLVVMSIDDGTGLTDLDPANDAIVVVVNGTDQELTHTVPTAAGFELHAVQQNSVDSTVTGASFSGGEGEGSFTVPALSVAIFVKPQGETQGEGLAANATAGAPDVVPYGDTEVFLRGDMNGWGAVDAFEYIGGGVYEVAVDLAAGSYSFKMASEDWSAVNNGAPVDNQVTVGEAMTLVPGSNDNMSITITEETSYIFSVDASDTSAPVLTVRYEEPFYGTTVYLRGDMNGWGTANPFVYMGNGQYQVSVTVEAGTPNFKVASEDWSTVNMGAPSDDKEVLEGEEQLVVAGSNDNFNMTLAAGEYTFIFNAKNLNEPTLTVYSAEMFGETTVYIRGGMNGWGEVDALAYQGGGVYSVDIDLEATSYEFKVASGDWATVNLGGEDGMQDVQVDTPEALFQNSQSNLTMDITEAGTYTFSVVGPNPENPTVTVTKK